MSVPVEIPGYGQAVAGLDWLLLPGLDGKSTEIKQLGRGVDAAWQFVWSVKGIGEEYVAFVSKGEVKKRPAAAASLVHAAIAEDLYLALVDAGEGRLWVFAEKDGVPAKRMDRVGDATDLMGLVKDFLSSLPEPSKAPIYTDKPELFQQLPFPVDIRSFSLEILGHSIKKRDFSKAAFSWYSAAPIGLITFGVVLSILAFGYYAYELQAEETAQREAVQIRQREIAQRKAELATAIKTAINATPPANITIPAYLETLGNIPRLLAGWTLAEVECVGQSCTLTYKAKVFATWAGYMKAKPAEWPEPSFDGDIEKVTQPIPVQFPSIAPRTADTLPQREKVRMDLGNLSQVSKILGLTITLPNAWQHVAGNPAAASPDEQWIPITGAFTATGSAVLLNDLAKRLPETAAVTALSFKLDEKLKFELKGKVYANP